MRKVATLSETDRRQALEELANAVAVSAADDNSRIVSGIAGDARLFELEFIRWADGSLQAPNWDTLEFIAGGE